MEVGFIGTGSMGKILIDAFIKAGSFDPSHMMIYNRTLSKAEELALRYPEIQLAGSMDELIRACNTIFICVRPVDYKQVLERLNILGRPNQTVISITSSVLINDLERWIPCRVIKMIPSITNAARSGTILVMYGSKIPEEEKSVWNQLFTSIGNPVSIEEQFVRVCSDITSCGPAFFSYLLQKFISGAVNETGISREFATYLASEMIIGLSQLISSNLFTLDTLQERVCVPGGVTGIGIAVLEEKLGPLFDHLFAKTHEKYREDLLESKQSLE